MSTFTLTIQTDNSDFREENGDIKPSSIARILRDVTSTVLTGDITGVIMDINGNKVGRFSHDEK